MSIYFGDYTWPLLEEKIKQNPLVIVPVGMYEEHGRHMAVSTDTDLIWAICEQAAEKVMNEIPVLLLPPVWTGYHGLSVSKWPGGIRLQQQTLYHVIYDICASLIRQGIRKIVVANGHGQNPAILELAVRAVIDDFDVMPVSCMPALMLGSEGKKERTSPQGSMGGHADEIETSLMLAVQEKKVHMEDAVGDPLQYHNKFVKRDVYPVDEYIGGSYWSTFEMQKTKNGCQGDPTYSTKEQGERFMKVIVAHFSEMLLAYYHFER